jgi:hypothetical protein
VSDQVSHPYKTTGKTVVLDRPLHHLKLFTYRSSI